MRKNKTAQDTAGRWTDRPGRPMPYGPVARLSDWWCAGRDARAGLPDLLVPSGRSAVPATAPETEATAAWATPRTVFLGQLGRGLAEQEWVAYQAEVAPTQVQLTQAVAKRDTTNQRLAKAEARLAKLAEPTPEQLRTRVSGEERTSDAVLAGRRRREHTERRRSLESDVATVRATLTDCDAEIARLRETIRIRFEVARTKAEIIGAYVQRRCAAYLTRLVRKHPKGKQIGGIIHSGWQDRPRWSTWDGPPELADAPALATKTGDA